MRKLFSLLAAVLFAGSMMAVEIYKNEGSLETVGGITVTAASGILNNTEGNGNPAPSFGLTSSAKNSVTFEGFDVADYSNLKLTLDARYGSFPNTVEDWPYLTIKFYKNGTLVQTDDETVEWNSKVYTYDTYEIDITNNFDKIVIECIPAEGKSKSGNATTLYNAYLDNITLTGDAGPSYCQVYDDDDLSSFTRADLLTEPYEEEGAVYYVLMSNPAWSAEDFAAALVEEKGMPSDGAAVVIGIEPLSLKNFVGDYDIEDGNLSVIIYQYANSAWTEMELEEGWITISVGEDGDTYDMEYEVYLPNETKVDGTMYGLCADEIDVLHPNDEEEGGFEYQHFVYDPEELDIEDTEAGYDVITVVAEDENEVHAIRLSFSLLHSENPQLKAGSYPVQLVQGVVEDLDDQIVLAGYYNDDDYSSLQKSYMMFSFARESTEIYQALWYLVSGNVVVDETGTINVNAKNSYGKDIKAKLVKDPGTGIQNTELENAPVKAIENGQFIIKRNGARFNAIGAQLR